VWKVTQQPVKEDSIMRTRSILAILPALMALATVSGCGKGEPAPLSVQGGDTPHRLQGSWQGEFVLKSDAPLADFPENVVAACRTMKVRIEFQAEGQLAMAASMDVPGVDQQTTNMQGRWRIVREAGDTLVVETTENGGESENGTLTFLNGDCFEMSPKNQLAELGVLRFTRLPN
jgi:hypothetical protein